jgi:hypothetical protein
MHVAVYDTTWQNTELFVSCKSKMWRIKRSLLIRRILKGFTNYNMKIYTVSRILNYCLKIIAMHEKIREFQLLCFAKLCEIIVIECFTYRLKGYVLNTLNIIFVAHSA